MEKIRPLFRKSDPRRRIPLAEVAKELGISTLKLRRYAKRGKIPGAKQFGRWSEWFFERDALEKWWQEFNCDGNPAGKK